MTNGNYDSIELERFSNNIQPIHICESKESNINNKWTNSLDENMICKSLYVTQNLLIRKENSTRIKWNGSIVCIFDYEKEKL